MWVGGREEIEGWDLRVPTTCAGPYKSLRYVQVILGCPLPSGSRISTVGSRDYGVFRERPVFTYLTVGRCPAEGLTRLKRHGIVLVGLD